jgi:ABC-2 type transport system permease protein
MISTLLSTRWLSIRNSLFRASRPERSRAWRGILFSLVVMGGVGAVAYAFLDPFVRHSEEERSLQLLLSRLPAFGLFSAFWMLLLSALTVGIQTFYLNAELGLLLSAPIRPRSIFFAKFFEATLTNAALFLTLAAPIGCAYGLAKGELTLPFIVELAVVLTVFSALPTALGIVCSFLLMRVLPANRTRDLLAAIGFAVFAGVYFLLSVSVSRLQNADAETVREKTIGLSGIVNARLLQEGPWAWAWDALSGNYTSRDVWMRIAGLAVLALVTVILAAGIAQWLHWRGWVTAQEGSTRGKAKAVKSGSWDARFGLLSGPVRAVFLKDMRTLRRDMRQLSLLFIPMAVVAVFLFNISENPSLGRIEPVLFVQTLFLILAPISLRLAMGGFIAESGAFWLTMSAPNDPTQTLLGKFIYAYVLSLPLGLIATVGYAMLIGMDAGRTAFSLTLVILSMAGFCGIGVGASAFFADFRVGNPRFTLSAGARLVMFGVQMGYLALISVATGLSWFLVTSGNISPPLVYTGAVVTIAGLSGAAAVVPLLLGAARLRRMEWGRQ